MQPLTKAVIPVTGHGTRLLPATKATPKEMLPLVDKPVLQYVVEEAVAAGLDDVLMVTGRDQRTVEDHFDRNPELEQALRREGAAGALSVLRRTETLTSPHYVRQGPAKGLGHAVLRAESHIGAEPFAVLLGDDLVDAGSPLLPLMVKTQQRHGGCVIAVMPAGSDETSAHGYADLRPAPDGGGLPVAGVVGEPSRAPDRHAVLGRFVLSPEIFPVLRALPPGPGGEVRLADALSALVRCGTPVHAVLHTGRRHGTGDPESYLRTAVEFACERPDIGPGIRAWLDHYVRREMPRP